MKQQILENRILPNRILENNTLGTNTLENNIIENRHISGKVIGGSNIPERQIRWNRTEGTQYNQSDLTTKMYFLLINQPREIETIQNKIYNFYQSVIDQLILFEDAIPKSDGLHYRCFSFETSNGILTPNQKIYAGKLNEEKFKIFYDPKLKIVAGQNEKALFFLQKYVEEKVCKINR